MIWIMCKKELGDLLLHVVFYSKMGSEQQAFDIGDVAVRCDLRQADFPPSARVRRDAGRGCGTGKAELGRPEAEGKGAGASEKTGACRRAAQPAGLGQGLPDRARRPQRPDSTGRSGRTYGKRSRRRRPRYSARSTPQATLSRAEEEFGDLFFALVNAARLYGVDAEAARSRKSNRKFIRRFTHIEDRAEQQGRSLRDMTLGQMDALWNEAKEMEKSGENER